MPLSLNINKASAERATDSLPWKIITNKPKDAG